MFIIAATIFITTLAISFVVSGINLVYLYSGREQVVDAVKVSYAIIIITPSCLLLIGFGRLADFIIKKVRHGTIPNKDMGS